MRFSDNRVDRVERRRRHRQLVPLRSPTNDRLLIKDLKIIETLNMTWNGVNTPSHSRTLEPVTGNKWRFRGLGRLPERLTKIELDVLTLLNLGMTNQEIADKLCMTLGTIKWYMNQIFSKLHVRNRIEALACARQVLALDIFGAEWPPLGPIPAPLRKIEFDILSLVKQGLTNREIAHSLALTEATTRWRISQIFGKLQARNRIEAITRARQFEWL